MLAVVDFFDIYHSDMTILQKCVRGHRVETCLCSIRPL
jgi:hypothetical protein